MTTSSVFWSWIDKTLSLILSPYSPPQLSVEWRGREVEQVHEVRYHFKLSEITEKNIKDAAVFFERYTWPSVTHDVNYGTTVSFHGKILGGGCCFSSQKMEGEESLLADDVSSTYSTPSSSQSAREPSNLSHAVKARLERIARAESDRFSARREPQIPLEASSWGQSSSAEPLEQRFISFYESPHKKVFLLIGKPGSGKTLFCQTMAHKLFQERHLHIPIIISLAEIENPESFLLSEFFASQGFTEEQLSYLKQQPLLLFIDGIDETRIKANLYRENHLEMWNVKVVFTATPDYLSRSGNGLHLFSSKEGRHPEHCVITSLSSDQITHYINEHKGYEAVTWERATAHQRRLLDEVKNNPFSRTPYSLRMLLLSLPHVNEKTPPLNSLYRLFKSFVLVHIHKHLRSVSEEFVLKLCRAFALKMHEKDTYQITYDPLDTQSPEGKEWKLVLKGDPELNTHLLQCAPLIKDGHNKWRFLFPALRDFFIVESLLIQQEKTFAGSLFLQALVAVLSKRLLTEDRLVLEFFCDGMQTNASIKAQLIDFAMKSKQSGASQITVANALSILQMTGFSFNNLDLKGIRAARLDLSRGFYLGTHFEQAQLQGLKWKGAFISGASVEGAQLEELETGEWPPLPHPAAVTHLQVVSEGKLAVRLVNQSVFLWDLASSQPKVLPFSHLSPNGLIGVVQQKEGAVFTNISTGRVETKKVAGLLALYFSPNSAIVALVSSKEILLVNSLTLKTLGVLKTPMEIDHAIAFSPDSKFLFVETRDLIILRWNLQTQKSDLSLSGHSNPIRALALHPQGDLLLSGGSETFLWTLSNPRAPQKIRGFPDAASSFSFSPSGQFLAVATDLEVSLWDFKRQEPLMVFRDHQAPINSLTFSTDETVLIAGAQDGRVTMWSLDFDTLYRAQTAFPRMRQSISGPKENEMISLTSRGTLVYWNAITQVILQIHENIATPTSTLHSINDKFAVILPFTCAKGIRSKSKGKERETFFQRQPSELKVWDKEQQKVIHEEISAFPFLEATLSFDGKKLATTHILQKLDRSFVSEITITNLENKAVTKFQIPGLFDLLTFSPRGEVLIFADSKGSEIYQWQEKIMKPSSIFMNPPFLEISHISFVEDQKIIITGSPAEGKGAPIVMYNIKTGQGAPVSFISSRAGPAAFSQKGKMLACVPFHSEESHPWHRQVSLTKLGFDPNAYSAAAAVSSSSTTQGPSLLEGNAVRIKHLAFTPSEDYLIATDENEDVMVWKMLDHEGQLNPIPHWRSSQRFYSFNVKTDGAVLSPLNRRLLEGAPTLEG